MAEESGYAFDYETSDWRATKREAVEAPKEDNRDFLDQFSTFEGGVNAAAVLGSKAISFRHGGGVASGILGGYTDAEGNLSIARTALTSAGLYLGGKALVAGGVALATSTATGMAGVVGGAAMTYVGGSMALAGTVGAPIIGTAAAGAAIGYGIGHYSGAHDYYSDKMGEERWRDPSQEQLSFEARAVESAAFSYAGIDREDILRKEGAAEDRYMNIRELEEELPSVLKAGDWSKAEKIMKSQLLKNSKLGRTGTNFAKRYAYVQAKASGAESDISPDLQEFVDKDKLLGSSMTPDDKRARAERNKTREEKREDVEMPTKPSGSKGKDEKQSLPGIGEGIGGTSIDLPQGTRPMDREGVSAPDPFVTGFSDLPQGSRPMDRSGAEKAASGDPFAGGASDLPQGSRPMDREKADAAPEKFSDLPQGDRPMDRSSASKQKTRAPAVPPSKGGGYGSTPAAPSPQVSPEGGREAPEAKAKPSGLVDLGGGDFIAVNKKKEDLWESHRERLETTSPLTTEMAAKRAERQKDRANSGAPTAGVPGGGEGHTAGASVDLGGGEGHTAGASVDLGGGDFIAVGKKREDLTPAQRSTIDNRLEARGTTYSAARAAKTRGGPSMDRASTVTPPAGREDSADVAAPPTSDTAMSRPDTTNIPVAPKVPAQEAQMDKTSISAATQVNSVPPSFNLTGTAELMMDGYPVGEMHMNMKA